MSRSFHDRLAVIEAGVEQDGHARDAVEVAEQPGEGRSHGRVDGLHAGGAIDVDSTGDPVGFLRVDLGRQKHERGGDVQVEPVAGVIG
ncbi:hypothetical protein OHB15_26960 [Streptosporangium subroseum]|nr:hypothetical protein OHB15_26960 [Streptosporangium subroseum]